MDTAFLRNFLLVLETGSKSEAARRLNLTPAAITQQIHALEREFGVLLLARSGRTVQATDAGRRIASAAGAALQSMADLKDLANADSLTGELKLGTINTALHSFLPDMLKQLVNTYPQVRVRILLGASIDLYDQVQRGDVDAAICIRPQFVLPKTMAWRLLREEPLVVLAPARFAKRAPHDLLQNEPFIRYDRAQWGGRAAERYLRSSGIMPNERFELSSLTAIAMMVDRELGVSLVPDAAPPVPAGLRLVKLKPPMQAEQRQVILVWMRSSPRLRLVKLFEKLTAQQ